jgi:Flp pilus assembly protein TadG
MLERIRNNRISRTLSRIQRDKKGSTAVEFALTFPGMLILTFFIFDVGRAMFTFSSMNHAAAEAARYASMHGIESANPATEEEIVAVARAQALGVGPNEVSVEITWTPSSYRGATVEVTMTYNLDFILTGFLNVDGITAEAKASMMII